ncbi:MAG: hypothetical protein WCA44_18080 [Acidobacteriaceae bacterium]
MITFKSVGHFFAKAFKAIVADIPKIEATEKTVEAVTAAIPGASAAVPLEDAAYAVLGEFASVLTTGGEAASQKLANAGVDVSIVQQVETLLKSFPNLVSLAKKL